MAALHSGHCWPECGGEGCHRALPEGAAGLTGCKEKGGEREEGKERKGEALWFPAPIPNRWRSQLKLTPG